MGKRTETDTTLYDLVFFSVWITNLVPVYPCYFVDTVLISCMFFLDAVQSCQGSPSFKSVFVLMSIKEAVFSLQFPLILLNLRNHCGYFSFLLPAIYIYAEDL